MNEIEYKTTIVLEVTPKLIWKVLYAFFTGKKLSITHTFDRNPLVVEK